MVIPKKARKSIPWWATKLTKWQLFLSITVEIWLSLKMIWLFIILMFWGKKNNIFFFKIWEAYQIFLKTSKNRSSSLIWATLITSNQMGFLLRSPLISGFVCWILGRNYEKDIIYIKKFKKQRNILLFLFMFKIKILSMVFQIFQIFLIKIKQKKNLYFFLL